MEDLCSSSTLSNLMREDEADHAHLDVQVPHIHCGILVSILGVLPDEIGAHTRGYSTSSRASTRHRRPLPLAGPSSKGRSTAFTKSNLLAKNAIPHVAVQSLKFSY